MAKSRRQRTGKEERPYRMNADSVFPRIPLLKVDELLVAEFKIEEDKILCVLGGYEILLIHFLQNLLDETKE